ncbi:MAG: tetratricopeptide repeat protein [Treponema sp.]|jgi:tetratricopeptide (TPR) repeat protein|nr:tetratricopeptide repeat protein [Treponema sp.]
MTGRLKINNNEQFNLSGILPVLAFFSIIFISCLSSAVKAEEFFALGTAFFELKKYSDAEIWFLKAKNHPSTKVASEYNLGRIAYETGRYRDAENYFERVLHIDKENIIALKAAAYTCIRLEELDRAEKYYKRILDLVPESYDEGYNYALVLSALGKAKEAENVLVKYNNTENPKALLIIARAQKQQGKPEAADAYNASLLKDDDPAVRVEYAAYLAETGLSTKALEEYKKALESSKLSEEKKSEINKAIEELK